MLWHKSHKIMTFFHPGRILWSMHVTLINYMYGWYRPEKYKSDLKIHVGYNMLKIRLYNILDPLYLPAIKFAPNLRFCCKIYVTIGRYYFENFAKIGYWKKWRPIYLPKFRFEKGSFISTSPIPLVTWATCLLLHFYALFTIEFSWSCFLLFLSRAKWFVLLMIKWVKFFKEKSMPPPPGYQMMRPLQNLTT